MWCRVIEKSDVASHLLFKKTWIGFSLIDPNTLRLIPIHGLLSLFLILPCKQKIIKKPHETTPVMH